MMQYQLSLFYYNIPMNIDSNYKILIEEENQTSLIKRQKIVIEDYSILQEE